MTPIERTRAALQRGNTEEIKSALGGIGGMLETLIVPDLPPTAELPREASAAIDVLGESLGFGSWHVRRLAASILVETGAVVIPMLGRLVGTGNLDQVYWACYVLARLDSRAGPLLARVVTAPNREHRLYAIHALTRRKEADAVSSLILALDDLVWSTRRKAADALIARADRDRVVEALRDEVTRGNRNRIYWGIRVLSTVLGERALPILKSLISWKDDDLRYLGIVALGKLRTPDVAQLLLGYLADPSQVVREKAVDLLALHADAVRLPLLDLANTALPETRFWALKALHKIGPDDFVPRCRALLASPTPELRYVAIRALSLSPPAEAVPHLISCFQDPLWVVRKFASDSIVRMGEPSIPALYRAMVDGAEDIQYWSISTLARLGRPALPGLREALVGGDRTARGFAIASLADSDLPQEALGLLVEAFGDEHWPLRRQAAETVRGHGARAVPYLIAGAFHTDDNRRFWSRKVLGELLGPELATFAAGLEKFPEGVQQRTVKALAVLPFDEVRRAILLDADQAVAVLKAPAADAEEAMPAPGSLLPQVSDDPGGYLVRLMKLVQDGRGVEVYLRAGIPPTVRVDDGLVRIEAPALANGDIKRIVELVRTDARSAEPATGSVEVGFDLGVIGRCRARVFHEARGPVVVIRPLGLQPPRLRDIGDEDSLEPLTRMRTGLIVISGPPLSGRSWTAHALIDAVNGERAVHVATVEQPVEHQHPPRVGLVTQLGVPLDASTFAEGFRMALASDARVIHVSDLIDGETTMLALEAAASTALVIVSLRAVGSVAALRIMMELTGARRDRALALMAASLRASISQVLLPHVTGKGTVVAREILLGVPNVLHPLAQGRWHEIEKLMGDAPPEGLRSFPQALRNLVARGVISQTTAREAAPTRAAASEPRILEGRGT